MCLCRCFFTRGKNSSHSHVEPQVTESPSSRRPLETATLPHHAPPSTSSSGIIEIVQDMRNTLTWLTTGNGLSSWSSGSVNIVQVHQRIVVMGDVPTDSGHMISPLSSSSQVRHVMTILPYLADTAPSRSPAVVKGPQVPEEFVR